MAEVQPPPSTSPSAPRAAGGDPEDPSLVPPMQQQREGGGNLPEEEETPSQPQPPPPHSTAAPFILQPQELVRRKPTRQEELDVLELYLSLPDVMYRKRRTVVLQSTALVARAAAAGLCLAALAVQAADTRKGRALDSYSKYTQLRYSEAVNVIGFMYAVFQFFALLVHWMTVLFPRAKGNYFDFTMDQVLAYLLISSSTSATVQVSDWIDNHWGSDLFPTMTNYSIAISFMAFMVFAINSLISAINLFRRYDDILKRDTSIPPDIIINISSRSSK